MVGIFHRHSSVFRGVYLPRYQRYVSCRRFASCGEGEEESNEYLTLGHNESWLLVNPNFAAGLMG